MKNLILYFLILRLRKNLINIISKIKKEKILKKKHVLIIHRKKVQKMILTQI